jgi:hypothetical protein
MTSTEAASVLSGASLLAVLGWVFRTALKRLFEYIKSRLTQPPAATASNAGTPVPSPVGNVAIAIAPAPASTSVGNPALVDVMALFSRYEQNVVARYETSIAALHTKLEQIVTHVSSIATGTTSAVAAACTPAGTSTTTTIPVPTVPVATTPATTPAMVAVPITIEDNIHAADVHSDV